MKDSWQIQLYISCVKKSLRQVLNLKKTQSEALKNEGNLKRVYKGCSHIENLINNSISIAMSHRGYGYNSNIFEASEKIKIFSKEIQDLLWIILREKDLYTIHEDQNDQKEKPLIESSIFDILSRITCSFLKNSFVVYSQDPLIHIKYESDIITPERALVNQMSYFQGEENESYIEKNRKTLENKFMNEMKKFSKNLKEKDRNDFKSYLESLKKDSDEETSLLIELINLF